jgi:hypothetical protein
MTATIHIQDNTTPGTLSQIALHQLVWGLRYQALYQYNRSPWVERGYATRVQDVIVLPKGQVPPPGWWLIELLDECDQPGALGYHENRAFSSTSATGPRKGSDRSSRGIALHPQTGEPVPLAKIGVLTSRNDGVQPSEVASHELLEMSVDPDVMDESRIRKYLDTASRRWYIGEVCDATQGRGYDVGAPEKHTTGVVVADFCYPSWWRQPQKRSQTSFAEEAGLAARLEPFTIAAGGYMSVAPEADPTRWTQINA